MARIYPAMSRGYSKALPYPFSLLSFFGKSLSHNIWSKVVLCMHTRYTINSTTSNHYPDRSGRAWLPAIFTFIRGEHVVAAFLDVEKAFENVWHNGLRYKIFQLDLPTKMIRWLSDFLVGHVIEVNINGFLSNQINPKAGVPQGFVLSPLLYYFSDLRERPSHTVSQTSSLSQFADDTAQWAFSLNVRFGAKLLQQDLLNLAMWCAKWRIELNPGKTKVIIFSRSKLARKTKPNLKMYGETLKLYSQVKFLGITFDFQLTFQNHFEDILNHCNTRYHQSKLLADKKWGHRPSTIVYIYKQCIRPIK